MTSYVAGEKPFTCEICGKCFSVKSTLQTHIRIHRGEKPYSCTVCDKSFADRSAYRRHVASHSGKKPFNCSACGLSFSRLDNLKTHINTHDKERVSKAESTDQGGGGAALQAQVQKYQLESGSEQEIQLLVTGDNISLTQEIGTVTPQIQMPGALDTQAGPPRTESMYVITLSKEAAEHLHVAHGPAQ